ncbi:DUF4197 domain-containing protein [Marinoscillum sp. MHG1-6]|uniref:DUF4197 domain-containing protein n=1 Tax=Marinoscillum sp. MHG1-6 TaxID=2959627 RepID=UPI0021584C1C|nr:DUF4197 domain-containing protein [Marinoscillum sp. MHG1-6]
MKNIRSFTVLILFILLAGCTAQQIQQALGDYMDTTDEVTTDQVVAGLREALTKGISIGADNASQVNGFLGNPSIKIPFPPDVQKVEDKLRQLGLGNQVDQFVETLNHGAEEAAKEAKPIFISAIQSMTIQDAWGILKGEDDAATSYLRRTTSDELRSKFQPVIKNALDKTNATKYYSDIITTYNKIPLLEDVNSDLEAYATERALDGLFFLVAEEEAKIRVDPMARTTDLLKRVFKEQD